MTRKHFEAKAAEFARLLSLVRDNPDRKVEILREIEQYENLAAEVNSLFDRARFRAACGLAVLPMIPGVPA